MEKFALMSCFSGQGFMTSQGGLQCGLQGDGRRGEASEDGCVASATDGSRLADCDTSCDFIFIPLVLFSCYKETRIEGFMLGY